MNDKTMFVPSRARKSLIELVNKHRRADDISWPKLIETLFIFYLKNGLPQIDRKPKRKLKAHEI